MSDSARINQSSRPTKNRRRALLIALFGAGAPLAQRAIPGEWVAPVVDTVLLPAHAQTSPSDDEESFPTGDFGSAETADAGRSLFEDIVDRTEEEILDLFIRSAEAAGTCQATNCSDQGNGVTVDVVASFPQNPGVGCVQARVTTNSGSCDPTCVLFDFDANVDGESVEVTVPIGCTLELNGMTLTPAGLSGSWDFNDGDVRTDNDNFFAAAGSGGCGSLGCPGP